MTAVVLVAAAALIDPDGRVLLARAAPGKPHSGSWEFPGGKVEAGERPEQALVRELREELGVETEASCLAPVAFASEPMGEGETRHLVLLVFACRKWRGTAWGREGQKVRWFEAKRLTEAALAPADRPVAAQLRDLLTS